MTEWWHQSGQTVLEKADEYVIVLRRDGALYVCSSNEYIRRAFCYGLQKLTEVTLRKYGKDSGNWTVPLLVIKKYSMALRRFAKDNDDDQVSDCINGCLYQLAKNDPIEASQRAAGLVNFPTLSSIFTEDTEVVFGIGRNLIAGKVASTKYATSWSGVVYFEIRVRILTALQTGLGAGTVTTKTMEFNDWVKPDTLDIQVLTPALKVKLSQRGQRVASISNSASYMKSTGNVTQRSWWGDQVYRAEGRCMIDVATYRRIEMDSFNNLLRSSGVSLEPGDPIYSRSREFGAVAAQTTEISESEYYRVLPWVYGFSFAAKQWGEFHVDDIEPIEFRKDAFDKLVLPAETKTLIKALIQHNKGTFSDLIEAKGGGVIFLLHGRPGGGKTLTAESVSELLERPLYSVSVGELGTDPAKLESSLRQILDVATIWNAIILLDEADIFLEARDEHDIIRNAMVGVFLRLLEYQQGVLFLTTNRVRNFDPAFHSRISIALAYPEMSTDIRRKIWVNLLQAAEVAGLDIETLAGYEINGRQIKNAIRLAQALARSEGAALDDNHIARVVALADKFEKDVQG